MGYSKKETKYLRDLGARIRNLRIERGWSQEELAFNCELHRTYIGAVERGERNLSVINLKKLADAFNLHVRDLFN